MTSSSAFHDPTPKILQTLSEASVNLASITRGGLAHMKNTGPGDYSVPVLGLRIYYRRAKQKREWRCQGV